jgi:hypothetical protein
MVQDQELPWDIYGTMTCAASPRMTNLPDLDTHLSRGLLVNIGHLRVRSIIFSIFVILGFHQPARIYGTGGCLCLTVCRPGIPSVKDSSHFFDFTSRLPRAGIGMVDVVEDHVERFS